VKPADHRGNWPINHKNSLTMRLLTARKVRLGGIFPHGRVPESEVQARSSGGERYLDTVEVGGSKPPAPITRRVVDRVDPCTVMMRFTRGA
jgi:hypothetical protein